MIHLSSPSTNMWCCIHGLRQPLYICPQAFDQGWKKRGPHFSRMYSIIHLRLLSNCHGRAKTQYCVAQRQKRFQHDQMNAPHVFGVSPVTAEILPNINSSITTMDMYCTCEIYPLQRYCKKNTSLPRSTDQGFSCMQSKLYQRHL